MKFHYIATQSDGKVIEETIEAKNVEEVLTFIAGRELKPISVRPVEGSAKSIASRDLFGGRINLTDQVFLSKYLSLMLKLGTGLLQAINILIEDFTKPAVRSFLLEVRSNLERGIPFHIAFARHPKEFGQVFINSVRAGEASGSLERIFDNLTRTLTKEKELKDQIRSALFYPIILFVSSVLILVFLVMFALPKIAAVFLDAGFEPPLFSRIIFSIGLFLGDFGVYFIVFFILLSVFFFVFYRTSLVFKRFIISVFSSLPLVRGIVKKISVQRFAATMASLIKAGMPITDALEITADSISQPDMREALLRISREGITKGLTVGEAFKRESVFPRSVVNLIAISEKAGHIEDVLETMADFYVIEIDSSLKTLVSFLEPIMLAFIGLIIGLIALAIVVPIYQLTIQF